MASFDFTVDTGEMAHSIDGLSAHVGSVTTAVVTMQAAVLAAETAAAERICKNVDRGFFSLIRSQITQKIARLQSEVGSRFLEMHQQSLALRAIKSRMEHDYHMIAARYVRLFHSVDLSLRNRVLELNRRVSNFAMREADRLHVRALSLQAQPSIHQSESMRLAQMVSASQTKGNARRAILGIRSFLSNTGREVRLLESMSIETRPSLSGLRYLPVAVCETDGFSVPTPQWEVHAPRSADARIDANVNSGVQTTIFASLQQLKWEAVDAKQHSQIASEYRRLVGQSGLDKRAMEYMLRMFESSSWWALSGERS